jgi:hypothetical protein
MNDDSHTDIPDDSAQESEQHKQSGWIQPREMIETMDKEVEAIIGSESDRLMAVEDAARERQFAPPEQKKSLKAKLKQLAITWWQNKRLRNGTFIGLFFVVVAAMFIPMSRYFILNTVGVRVSASMVVVDSESGRPLKNIPVKLQGKEARTNDDGYVVFERMKQGRTAVIIDKIGFAPYKRDVTLGWGSNRLDEQSIVVTGARFNFVLKDWLSGDVLAETEAVSGENVGQADEEGRIELVVGTVDESSEVTLSAKGYRDERLKLSELTAEETVIEMVVAKKHAFVSNRDGEYDLYTIDADATNEKLLLAATKKEREVPFILSHPTKDTMAFVSSRDGDTNKDGYVLDGLFVVDAVSGETYKVTRSEQIQVIGWVGDKLVYVAVIEGVSAGNSQRSKLFSFDILSKERKELASANYFNDVKLIGDTIYCAVSSYAVPRSQAQLFQVSADGTNRKTVIEEQVWSIVRQDYDTLLYNTESNIWYEQGADGELTKRPSQPTKQETRHYADSPNGANAVWVDIRDGKGVLLQWSIADKKETSRLQVAGLNDPAYWISDAHIVYRVSTSDETADYIVHASSGEPQKIADVIGNRSRYFY